MSCLYKVFEKIVLKRLDKWLKKHNVISNLQGAFQDSCSSKEVVLLLQETISHYTERGNTVYIILLDVAKAFDSVWIEGLMFKLYNFGINGKLWCI